MVGQDGILDWAQAQVADLAQPMLAKLQAQVGLFLADKAVLLQAQQRADTPGHRQQAQQLYAEQLELEGQLGQVLPAIQAGQYDLGTITQATALYARIELHHKAVSNLRNALGLPAVSAGIDWSTVALFGGGALALLGVATRRLPVMVAGGAVAAYGLYQRGRVV